MAHFRGGVKGMRDNWETRLGGTKTGIETFANGWHLGIRVYGRVNEQGKDEFQIYKTGGSTNSSGECIATITE